MAVRRPKTAHELIQKWQNENSECSMPLNVEVIPRTEHTNYVRVLVDEWMVLNC
jgi:hypothetical protein